MRTLVIICLFAASIVAHAASPYKRSLEQKKNQYIGDGVFIGGKANSGGISLLNIRRTFSGKAKVERVMIDLGDKEMKPLTRDLSYFQASMDSKNNRVVLDLAQFKMSRVSESQLRNLFRKSPYVKSADLTLDPEDKAATLVLNLKQPMRMEVFKMTKGKTPGRIVMDLTPAASKVR